MEQNNIQPASGEPTSLAGQLEQAFEQIGSTMMSDEFAARLLAYVYVMGGGNEAVVLHVSLNAGIKIAQQKANIYGGCVPNADMVPLIQKSFIELEAGEKIASLKKLNGREHILEICKKVPWLMDIFKRYDIEPYFKPSLAGKNRK